MRRRSPLHYRCDLCKFAKFDCTDSNVRKRLLETCPTNGIVVSFQYVKTSPPLRLALVCFCKWDTSHLEKEYTILRCKGTKFLLNKQGNQLIK